MRAVLLKAHLVVALAAGAFLAVLGATGAVMAFEEPLAVLARPDLMKVPPGGKPLPLATLARIVGEKHPGEAIRGVVLPGAPGHSTVVQTSKRPVFVDGATGAILGTFDGGGLIGVLGIVHQIHVRLVPGLRSPVLHAVLGGASVALFLLVVSGAFLWWRGRRLAVRFGGGAFRFSFDVHHAAGFWSGLFLLVASLTGVVLAWDVPILGRLYAATGTRPAPRTAPSKPRDGAVALGPDRALEIARAALPGAAPVVVEFPQRPEESWNVRMRYPEDATPGGRSWVAIDRYTGEVLVRQSSREAPPPARALMLVRALHTGDVAGTPSRVVMSLSSLLLVVQTLSGIVLWGKRPRTAKARPGD